MRVRATKGFSLGGGRDLQAGDVIEVEDTPETRERVRLGKFEEVADSVPLLTQAAYRKPSVVRYKRETVA